MKSLSEIKDNPRITVLASSSDNMMGFVRLRKSGKPRDYSIVCGFNEGGYEHVSISCRDRNHLPTWDEMCELKDICFDAEEEVVQVHPKKSEYVNLMGNCLHLWRKIGSNYFDDGEIGMKGVGCHE